MVVLLYKLLSNDDEIRDDHQDLDDCTTLLCEERRCSGRTLSYRGSQVRYLFVLFSGLCLSQRLFNLTQNTFMPFASLMIAEVFPVKVKTILVSSSICLFISEIPEGTGIPDLAGLWSELVEREEDSECTSA